PRPFCTTSRAALTRRPVDALASNVCGSVFGLLMMALACTYFPPTCAITSAYSFSAPTAMILPSAPGWPAADEDVQPAASRAAPARAAHARMALGRVARLLRRFGMAGFSQVRRCQRSFGVALPVMIMILTFVCNAVGRGGAVSGCGVAGLQAAGCGAERGAADGRLSGWAAHSAPG